MVQVIGGRDCWHLHNTCLKRNTANWWKLKLASKIALTLVHIQEPDFDIVLWLQAEGKCDEYVYDIEYFCSVRACILQTLFGMAPKFPRDASRTKP